jgi:hypothetical protein
MKITVHAHCKFLPNLSIYIFLITFVKGSLLSPPLPVSGRCHSDSLSAGVIEILNLICNKLEASYISLHPEIALDTNLFIIKGRPFPSGYGR